VIELAPLTITDSSLLIENLLKIENMPDATRQMILSKAEGNPFFLEELLSSLLDTGYVLREGDRAVTTGAITKLDMPDTLQGVIAARIDRLPPEDKHTLQTASVLGRVFQPMVLGKLLAHDPVKISLDAALVDLQQKELIRWMGEFEYVFKHAITQEVTYNSLLIARRKELHCMSAKVIESLFPGQIDELSATLAYHYERAEIGDKAIYYLMQAAERARKTYSNAEAIAFYQTALKLANRLQCDELQVDHWGERTAQLYEGLGNVLAFTGHNDEARNAYREALVHAPENDGVWQSRLYRNMGNTWRAQRQPDEAQAAYDQANNMLEKARAEADPIWQQETLEISLDRMDAYYFSNFIAQMQALVENIAPTIRQIGSPIQRARYFSTIGNLAFRQNRYKITDTVLGYAKTALAASQDADHKGRVIAATFQLGFCYLWRGDFGQAEVELKAALELTEQIGDREFLITILTWLTVTYRRSNQLENVRQYAARSLEIATLNKTPLYIGLAKANQAWIDWQSGNITEAQVAAHAALDLLEQGQAVIFCKWLALLPLMEMDLRLSNDVEAIAYACALIHPTQMRLSETLEAKLAEAIKAWDGCETDKAHVLMQQAVEIAQQTGWL
jgi:tetratricopeptide (TPR) repeat protein